MKSYTISPLLEEEVSAKDLISIKEINKDFQVFVFENKKKNTDGDKQFY